MYKVRFGKGKTLYFKDWQSACEFCVLAGVRTKIIAARSDRGSCGKRVKGVRYDLGRGGRCRGAI